MMTTFVEVEDNTFEERKEQFIAGLRRDSLAAGAIPNPHAKVGIPRVKFMRLLINSMFSRGLPKGWGK